MPLLRALALAVLALVALGGPVRAESPIPRTVIALIEGDDESRLRDARSHQIATMPLEHLGLIVEYHRADQPLPDLSGRDDVRGVFTWLSSPSRPGALRLLEWFESALDAGKKLVVMGDLGVSADPETGAIPLQRINRLLRRIGVRMGGEFIAFTAGSTYTVHDKRIWGFEHQPLVPPAYSLMQVVDPEVTTHLEIATGHTGHGTSALVVTGPNGGIVSPLYAVEVDHGSNIRRWRVNPFEFFRLAFATDDLPKPDTTTLTGRRLYYSHVDGDGWRSVSEVKIDDESVSAARVLLERVVRLFPDLPVTIAPIAAELDPDWIDDSDAREVADGFFALPHVEAGSHTYSHPFNWSYFEQYNPRHERDVVQRVGIDHPILKGYAALIDDTAHNHGEEADLGKYALPRAFFTRPYDLDREIAGSLAKIGQATGREVKVLQWSGDTTPYEAAVAATRAAGIPNINGGDTRFDSDYRSYGFVAPISVPVGDERQIYASMSNENTYTDLWTGRFYAFRHLLETVRRTGLPIRVKPINVYYHSYSAEKVASTNALIQVHEAMRGKQITPVTTSDFARAAGGFYTTRLIALGDRRWRVEGRGALQTLRFDNASLTAVDFARSEGVLGARPAQGSLYVALDPAVARPVVALTDRSHPLDPDPAAHPYLLESRWPVSDLTITEDGGVEARTEGFGPLTMTWIAPREGTWQVRLIQDGDTVWRARVAVGPDRRIAVDAGEDAGALTPTTIRLDRVGD